MNEIGNDLEIGQKVKMLRKSDSGSWQDAGLAVVRNFAYSAGLEKKFASVEPYQDGKLVGITEIVSLSSLCFKVVKW